MKRFYALMLMMCTVSVFSLFSAKVIRETSKKDQQVAPEMLTEEQQELKIIQEKLLQDVEQHDSSFPAFDYKDVAGAIQVLDKVVADALIDLDSGIKVFIKKTVRDMDLVLALIDTSRRISPKLNQEKLKQLRDAYKEAKEL